MSWHEGPLGVLDLEATGVDPRTARIIEVALLRFEVDGSSTVLVDRLIDPGVPIPAVVTDITGISTGDVVTSGGDPVEVLAAARDAVAGLVDEGVPIAIYKATYDWPLLGAELARHGLGALPSVPPAVLIDPLVLDRHVERYRKGKRTLEAVANYYGVRLDGA
ncbi:MAG: exonuclease domain-containing protein, partial [Actinomycetia bacterium]|nr:exonuclease domain-containing protein [Actinomycetes bacterium]